MHKGGCLCGAVTYEINGDLGPIMLCHCSRCRKVNGTAFNAASPVRKADFRILTGLDKLTDFESSPGVGRVFCSVCGSPIFSRRDAFPEVIRLRIGTLDTPVNTRISAHIFVASKAEWFDIRDDAPQHPERP
ncbi:MAG: GFA family protein [Acidiferrobacterales bacterium]